MAAKTTGAGQMAENLLKLIFQAVGWPNVADNASAVPLTSLIVTLHTADPGPTGNQTTNEAAYASYARLAVVRSALGWAVAGNQAKPVANLTFPTATGGSETETWFGIGTASSGAGHLLYRGRIGVPIVVSTGLTPFLSTDTVIIEV